jgi:hypothetical protein
MDSSCSVLPIAAVTDTGDVGVKVAREVVEEEHIAHHVFERAESMCPRSFSAIAQSLFPNPGMAPLLFSCMNTVRVYPPNAPVHWPANSRANRRCLRVLCNWLLGTVGS